MDLPKQAAAARSFLPSLFYYNHGGLATHPHGPFCRAIAFSDFEVKWVIVSWPKEDNPCLTILQQR